MIRKLFNQPHVLYQSNSVDEFPNTAVCVHVDNGGTICIEQEDNCIVLNPESVPELCKLLKKLAEAKS